MKALVAGSAHLDILARPFADSSHRDREGDILIEAGGTACNVAFNLRRLGHPVRLLTAWGPSAIAHLMGRHIKSTGVELMTDEVPGMPLAAFGGQLTAAGDLASAISSMPVASHSFSPERIAEALERVDYVIVEANLSADALLAIATEARARSLPVFALGVSEDKVARLLPILSLLDAAFMNAAEAERLMTVAGAADPGEIASDANVTLIVTRGERGAVAYYADGRRARVKATSLPDLKNLLGVGDAFSVGVIDGMVRYSMAFEAAAEHAHLLVGEIARSDACNAFSMNALSSMVSELYEDARNDALTGLMRREAFEFEYSRYADARYNTLVMIDCDRFKTVNDTLGHMTGDRVLQNVAKAISSSIRGPDLPSRWGGDEFVLLLPRTAASDGQIVAERIRQAAESMELHGVTLSMGVAESSAGEQLADVVKRADAAMYDAKHAGRNVVVLAA